MKPCNLSGNPLLFIYALQEDTGFAPCVQDGLLSLACCKQPLRKCFGDGTTQSPNGIPAKWNDKSTPMFVMGVMHRNKLPKEKRVDAPPSKRYHLVYLAQITDVITMKEYFGGIGEDRLDGIYDSTLQRKDCKLIRNGKGVHLSESDQSRDRKGGYVLLSDKFLYLGEDAPDILDMPEVRTTKAVRHTKNGLEEYTSIMWHDVEFAPSVLGKSTRTSKRAWAEGKSATAIVKSFWKACDEHNLTDKQHLPVHAKKLNRYAE